MQRQEVGHAEDFIHGKIVYVVQAAQFRTLLDVEGRYAHAEGACTGDDFGADLAGTNHSQYLAVQLTPHHPAPTTVVRNRVLLRYMAGEREH